MPKQEILSGTQYAKLVKDIRAIIEEGKADAQKAVRQSLVKTYWKVGRRISEAELSQNAGYNQAILEDLAEELVIDYTTLNRCVHFFQSYSLATSGKNLTWSHYKRLLPLTDETERAWYENLVEEDRLNVAQLGKAIQENRYGESRKAKTGDGSPSRLKRPTEATYIYKAIVERVIDGDTLLLKIDLGFAVWKEQRVRLANIDTPAMDEPEGKKAYQFVLKELAKSEFVMVKTNKIDIYGRYVGHIFYSPKDLSKEDIFTKGAYLNQALLDAGLARIL